jgi:hypothetical protein
MPASPPPVSLEPGQQRRTAAELFNHAWALIEKRDRTPRETDLMIHAAHGSRFLWEDIGEPVKHARGEWQIARVYALALRPEPALHHARRCLEICEKHDVGDFDLAYAHEALARAHAIGGEHERSRRHVERGREVAQRIGDPGDRDLVLGDLAALP